MPLPSDVPTGFPVRPSTGPISGAYDERDAASILRRAAEIHAAQPSVPGAHLTLDDLIAAGAAAALSADAVRAAALEARLGGDDAPGHLRRVHVVPHLPDEAWGPLGDAMRRAHPGSDAVQTEDFGHVRRWSWDMGGVNLGRLTATPLGEPGTATRTGDDAVALTVEHNSAIHAQGLEWVLGAVGALVTLPVVAVLDASGTLPLSLVGFLLILVALTALGTGLASVARRATLARHQRRFDALAAEIATIASAASATARPQFASLALPDAEDVETGAEGVPAPPLRVRA